MHDVTQKSCQYKINSILSGPLFFYRSRPLRHGSFHHMLFCSWGEKKCNFQKVITSQASFLLSTEIPFPCPHEAQLCWHFPRWPTDIHLPEPAGTSSEGERVIVSHVRSVLRSSSETTKQVAVCVFAEPVYKWGTEPKPPAHSTRPQKAEGEQGPRSLLSAAGFSQQSSDL